MQSPGPIRIARAGIDDVDAVHDLFRGYLDFYRRDHDPGRSRAFLAERIERQQSVIFLAWLGDRAVGFVQLYPAFASLSLEPSWILNDLYVDDSARGQGAGTALMNAAREHALATGACEIFLQTARSNSTAQSLYAGLGYQRDDEFLVYTLAVEGD